MGGPLNARMLGSDTVSFTGIKSWVLGTVPNIRVRVMGSGLGLGSYVLWTAPPTPLKSPP